MRKIPVSVVMYKPNEVSFCPSKKDCPDSRSNSPGGCMPMCYSTSLHEITDHLGLRVQNVIRSKKETKTDSNISQSFVCGKCTKIAQKEGSTLAIIVECEGS